MNEFEPNHTTSTQHECISRGIMWWAMLIVGVLAIPAIAVIVAGMIPATDFNKGIIFIIACWVSTWIGMWLMKKSGEYKGNLIDRPGDQKPNE